MRVLNEVNKRFAIWACFLTALLASGCILVMFERLQVVNLVEGKEEVLRVLFDIASAMSFLVIAGGVTGLSMLWSVPGICKWCDTPTRRKVVTALFAIVNVCMLAMLMKTAFGCFIVVRFVYRL